MPTVDRIPTAQSALLFLLVCVVYATSLGNGFHYDDFHSVVRNPHIRELSRLPSYFTDPTAFSVNPASAMYRPLLLASYALDYALWGERAWGFHAVSITLHAAGAVTVLHLLAGLGFARSVAVGGGLVFAVHPVNTEAVCYVSSRSELLMGLFVLLACTAYLTFRRRGARGAAALTVAATVGGLLAKSVAVVAPALLVILDWFMGGWRRVRAGWAAYATLATPVLLYLLVVRRHASRALLDEAVRGAAAQTWTQVKAAAYYLWLVAMPTHLNVEHQFRSSPGAEPAAVFAGLLLVSGAVVVVTLRRRVRWAALAAVWSVVLMLPASLVPLIVLVNEHRLYIASAGFALAVSACLSALPARSIRGRVPVAVAAIAVYTCVLALLSVQRAGVWESELTLWEDSARKAPAMLRPHLRYADALARDGRAEEAEVEYLEALSIRPQHPATRTNLGWLYQDQGRVPEAVEQYQMLLRVSPDSVPARLNLAGLFLRGGRWQAARDQYQETL